MPEPLDLESVEGVIARATYYAKREFSDGIREPNPERRSAYNLIVYCGPQMATEIRRLRATVDRVRALADKLDTESPKPGPGGFLAEEIRRTLSGGEHA